jgi:probable phosphoglycerate mutase
MSALIYLVRHGQTIFNAERRLQGHLDSALTPLGMAQAESFGATLRHLVGNRSCQIVASPLGRAVQTASYIAKAIQCAPPVKTDADWMEISMGQWDGHTDAEIEAGWPNMRDGLAADHWHFHAPNGESFVQIAERVTRGLETAKAAQSEVFVIVSDGITSRVERGIWAGLTFNQLAGLPVPQDSLFTLGANGHIETVAVSTANVS